MFGLLTGHKKFKIFMKTELESRQNQFATLFEPVINPERLRGLTFCSHCGGEDYQWTDWTGTAIDPNIFDEGDDPRDYRTYLSETCCKICEGTGFEGGSWDLSVEEWLNIGNQELTKHSELYLKMA